MHFDRISLGRQAKELGFVRDTFEKVCRLADVLSFMESDSLLFIENNFNLCELGPRSTGKSHLYKEISPNSILVSGGQTTVANLFYNMGSKTVGLVGLWDCVAFDEVAGIHFKDKDGIQCCRSAWTAGQRGCCFPAHRLLTLPQCRRG